MSDDQIARYEPGRRGRAYGNGPSFGNALVALGAVAAQAKRAPAPAFVTTAGQRQWYNASPKVTAPSAALAPYEFSGRDRSLVKYGCAAVLIVCGVLILHLLYKVARNRLTFPCTRQV